MLEFPDIDIFGGSMIITSIAGMLPFLLIFLFAIVLIISLYVLKKYHFWPFVNYDYKVIWYAERGDEDYPVAIDSMGVAQEGDSLFFITGKERILIPYEYTKYLKGKYMQLSSHNRLEMFPYMPKTRLIDRRPKEVIEGEKAAREEKFIYALKHTRNKEYREILNDAPVQRYLAKQQNTRNKLQKPSLAMQAYPIVGFAIFAIFTLFLLTSIAEYIVQMHAQEVQVANINAQTAEHIDSTLSTLERLKYGGSTSTPAQPTTSPSDGPPPPY